MLVLRFGLQNRRKERRPKPTAHPALPSKLGSLAMFAAIRRASSRSTLSPGDTAENFRTQKTQTTAIGDSFFLRKIARECRKGVWGLLVASLCRFQHCAASAREDEFTAMTPLTPLKSLLLCFAITFATPTQAVDRNLYLIALAGQSNMTGKGNVNDLPLGFPKNAPRLWNFTNAYTWELAKEPVHRKSGVGPALALADAFVSQNPHVNVGLIPCAKSGSSIEQWQRDLSRSSLYGSCLYRQKLAKQQGKVRALVFWQGGADGKKKKGSRELGRKF